MIDGGVHSMHCLSVKLLFGIIDGAQTHRTVQFEMAIVQIGGAYSTSSEKGLKYGFYETTFNY
jgi:hypothetical protein